MSVGDPMMVLLILTAAVAAVLVIGGAFVLVRRITTPPIEIEPAASGIELDARRGALHDLSITVNDRPAVLIETVPAGPTVLPWSTLGFSEGDSQNLQQVSIHGRSGNRYFQTTISFRRNDNPPSESASQTWRFIEPPSVNANGEDANRPLTAAPEHS